MLPTSVNQPGNPVFGSSTGSAVALPLCWHPHLGSSAANAYVAACPKAMLAPPLGSSTASGGDVAACPSWVRARSRERRPRPDLRPGLRRPDRARLSRQHENDDDETQRDKSGPHEGSLPCTPH